MAGEMEQSIGRDISLSILMTHIANQSSSALHLSPLQGFETQFV